MRGNLVLNLSKSVIAINETVGYTLTLDEGAPVTFGLFGGVPGGSNITNLLSQSKAIIVAGRM